MFDQVNANSTASWPRRLLRSARKSDIPSSLVITASPSIRNDVRLDASGGFDNSREAVRPIMAVA